MSEPQNGRGALFAGGLAAILASTCCLGPLVLIALGFSGACTGSDCLDTFLQLRLPFAWHKPGGLQGVT